MNVQERTSQKDPKWYASSPAHLAGELKRLDGLIRRRVQSFRREMQEQRTTQVQQVYISHEEVDRLLSQEELAPSIPPASSEHHREGVLSREIAARVAESQRRGIALSLSQLQALLGLSDLEKDVVLICLAPELRRKYDRLYAYLQDDITRKKPSVDLVLDLLCTTEADRWDARPLLTPSAPLRRHGVIQATEDLQSPSGSSGLAQFLKLDPRILTFLLGDNRPDARLMDLVEVCRTEEETNLASVDPASREELCAIVQRYFTYSSDEKQPLVLHLRGRSGIGKRDLAGAITGRHRGQMLRLDAEHLAARGADAEDLLRGVLRESLLLEAPLYIERADALLETEASVLRKALMRAVVSYGSLVFLDGEKQWPSGKLHEQVAFHVVSFPVPETALQEQIWEKALAGLPVEGAPTLAQDLAGRFTLTPRRIRAAASSAALRHAAHGNGRVLSFGDLAAACRRQARQNMDELATRIEPHYEWGDLVLPDEKREQLQEICGQVRYHRQVFDRWGFGDKLSYGEGLSVLFTGPPGTGKTMAAEVIASDLHLDLYKVDLSGVVSKYIGETEKNLSRIFAEAQHTNAILFFDEADALFGKRTQIADAHDRYANIETSYLLQKMEEYEGLVMLASNLRENMDSAFLRRIRFVVEFPFPDAASRRAIWEAHFPAGAPVGEDVDVQLLAEQLHIAGGNIKNVVLNAAFRAAEDGNHIHMPHVVHGARREFEKIGKLWDPQKLTRQK